MPLQVQGLDIAQGRQRLMLVPSVVVKDGQGNPVVLVVEHEIGLTEVLTPADEPQFTERLALLGINVNTKVSKL